MKKTYKKHTPKYFLDKHGNKCMYDHNGKLHSYNDLPAIIFPAGSKWWYKHGLVHRNNNMPAIIWPFLNSKEYYINGKFIKEEYK